MVPKTGFGSKNMLFVSDLQLQPVMDILYLKIIQMSLQHKFLIRKKEPVAHLNCEVKTSKWESQLEILEKTAL